MLKIPFPGPGRYASYHNHSIFSDGKDSPEAMARAGKAAGLKEFGLSDHMVITPKDVDERSWSMKQEKLEKYVATLLALKEELDDDSFTLRLGLEVDFFFENGEEVAKRLRKFPLDYLIGGVHIAGNFPVDHSIDSWLDLSPGQKEEICEIYYQKAQGAAASGLYDFIAHMDLPKKFGLIKKEDYFSHGVKLLDLAVESHTAIELNTAGWFKECQEQYPTQELLQEACKRKIPVVISADAHMAEHVNRNFELAEKVLKEAGYPL